MAIAQELGLTYRTSQEIAKESLEEIIKRVEALPQRSGPEAVATAAILGGVARKPVMVSGLFEAYSELTDHDHRQKNAEQRRVWASARRRATRTFIEAVGDRPIEAVTRDHALRWRDWFTARIRAGKIKAESANKDFSNFSAMLNRVLDERRLPNSHPLSRVRIRARRSDKVVRQPIPDALIRSIILDADRMSGLDQQARDVLLVMLNTGARPSELIGLLPRHIHLEADVPHVSIREEARELKTGASVRDIPLVGVSLMAMRRNAGGFPAYFGRATAWGNRVNKYLRAAGLPAPLTAYGLRHAFADRLLDAEFSERIIADAMGHEVDRERYGRGLTLGRRRDVLLRIAY
jgi:integrase